MGYGSAERSKVIVFEMKCLRSLVGMSRMVRVSNENVCRRAGIEMDLASRQIESIEMVCTRGEIDEYCMARRVLPVDGGYGVCQG